MSDGFRLNKAVNCLTWLHGAVDKYEINPEYKKVLKEACTEKLKDREALGRLSSSTVCAALVAHLPESVLAALGSTRGVFDLSEEERLLKVQEAVDSLRSINAKFTAFIDSMEENKLAVARDMRSLSAYVEIFFGPFFGKQ